jgi:hypothetical protein
MWYYGSSEDLHHDEENQVAARNSVTQPTTNTTPNGKRKGSLNPIVSPATVFLEGKLSSMMVSNITKQHKQDHIEVEPKKSEEDEDVFSIEIHDSLSKQPEISPHLITLEDQIFSQRKFISRFLENHNCYSVIPDSGKIVVLDIALRVKSAFHALEENNIKSAPLWDSKSQDYVGIITVTDFIEILLHFHRVPNVNLFDELEKHQIKTWRGKIITFFAMLTIRHHCQEKSNCQ